MAEPATTPSSASDPEGADLTRLISAAASDPAARARLLETIYEELRAVARRMMSQERSDHTLQPTAVIHEAYLRLFGDTSRQWANRRHFFDAAAKAMRRLLVDYARKKNAQKRGGGERPVQLDMEFAEKSVNIAEVLSVDEALEGLHNIAPRKAEVVVLRYFAGFSIDEIAQMLQISPRTVDADWRFARCWLHDKLSDQSAL